MDAAYLITTVAPASSSFFLISSASCLEIFSFTFCGAPSTRSLASFRPRSGPDGADFLDDIDLLFAAGGQHDGKFGFLFDRFGRSSARAAGPRRRQRPRGAGGGDAPLFFEELGQFSGFQNGQGGQFVDFSSLDMMFSYRSGCVCRLRR